jgi:hypothetical protein
VAIETKSTEDAAKVAAENGRIIHRIAVAHPTEIEELLTNMAAELANNLPAAREVVRVAEPAREILVEDRD